MSSHEERFVLVLDCGGFCFAVLRQGLTIYSSGCPGTQYVEQAGFKITELCLTLPSEYWFMAPCLVFSIGAKI